MPRISTQFGQTVKEVIGERPVRRLSDDIGISHTAVYDMLNGRVPSYRLLEQFANSLNVTGGMRRNLFAVAGYVDPSASDSGGVVKDAKAAAVAERLGELTAEQLDMVRRLIDEPAKLDTLRVLFDGRVMHAPAFGCVLPPAGAFSEACSVGGR